MDYAIDIAQKIGNLGFWELDLINNKLYWSDQVYTIFNKDPDKFELTLDSFLDCIHHDDRDMVENTYNSSLETQKPYSIDHRIICEDGSIRYVAEQCDTKFDADGKPLKSYGVVQDITEKSETLHKLKDSEAKFKAISNQTTEGITVADMDGNYVFVNPAFCDMSGYTQAELLNLTVFDMKAENQDHTSFRESKTKMEGKAIRVNLKRKDSTEYFTEIIGNVINIGEEQLVLGTIRDITEQVKNEREIHVLNKSLESKVEERTAELNKTIERLNHEIEYREEIEQQLKESLESKNTLLREITHRVKNNLQIISSLISLQKSVMPEERCEFLDQIGHRVHSMALIHETLSENNQYDTVKFKSYTRSLLNYLSDSFTVGNIQIDDFINDVSLPIAIATNCGMIIMELITNALKYAFEGIENPVITLKFEEVKPNNYRLEIADNGIGFPSNLEFKNGSSLGMQIVNSLVETLHGEINQEVNHGTKYTITFSV